MRKQRYFFNLIAIAAILVATLGNASLVAQAGQEDEVLKADPRLLQMAEENPESVFMVIVQKDAKNKDLKDMEVEDEVLKGGGQVKKQLDLIVSFSAEMTGREITKLAKHPKVRWISADAPMVSSALPSGFGASGKVTTAIGSGADSIRALAVQPDGKIVVAGVASNGADNDFAVARYNTDGSLDATFDGDGKFTYGWGSGHDEANAVTIQPDGRIVVVGTSYNGSAFLYTLVRLNPNGSLDTTFDADGIVTTAVYTKNNDIAQSVLIQPDGKILAAGQSYNGSNTDFSLARYNSNGSLDTTFNKTGKVITAFGSSHDYIYDLAVQTDGKILVAGTSYTGSKYNFALARYTAAGALDKTFDGDGKLTTSMTTGTDRAYGMVLQPDGKILVAGESNFDFGLARYTTTGALDTTFGTGGKVTTPIGSAMDFGRSVALQADGKILVAGYGSNGSNNDFAVVRYASNGALDTTFDGDGKVTTAIGSGQDIGYSVKVQSDGEILVAGFSTGSNDDFALARYNTDGSLDCAGCIDTSKLANTYNRAVRADKLWNAPFNLRGQGITVAVVDSGIAPHAELQGRLMASINMTNEANASDNYAHGTHVAGIIGGDGSSSNYARLGMAPQVNLVNIKVSDSNGMSYASDLVEGLQWIYNNRAAYNIRVVNLSMNSTIAESYHTSPIDAAVEILWFNGIVVVVSAGNNGTAALYPPANDPFVITVGATEDYGTPAISDDAMAAFSAYGTTTDGFAKPDLVAPGRNIISLLASTNAMGWVNHPAHRVDNSYFRMSGTSMSAPVVSGAVALLLQDEPNLTPDQVKYRLKATANQSWTGYNASKAGAGYLDIYAAVNGTTTQSANTGIYASQMLSSGSEPITWGSVGWNSVGWNSVGWNSVGWNSVGWNSVGWNSGAVWDD